MRLRELNLSPATAPSAIGMPEAGGGHFACAVHVYYLAPVKSLDTCAPPHRSARLSQRLASELNVNAVNVEGSLFRSPWPLRLAACILHRETDSRLTRHPFHKQMGQRGPTRASRRQPAASKSADVRECCENKPAVLNTFFTH